MWCELGVNLVCAPRSVAQPAGDLSLCLPHSALMSPEGTAVLSSYSNLHFSDDCGV